MPQRRLAALVRANVSTVRRWENGEVDPRPYQRRPLADALQVPLHPTLDEIGLDWYLVRDGESEATGSVGEVGDDLGLDYDSSIPATLDAVDALGHADMERRAFLRTALFAVGASVPLSALLVCDFAPAAVRVEAGRARTNA